MARLRLFPALIVALAYAGFGMVWIAASDGAVAALTNDPHLLTLIQTSKGWFFVLVSAGLIYGLVRVMTAKLEASERRYRLMFGESPMPMVVYTPHSLRCVEVNVAARRTYGYGGADMTLLTLLDLVAPEDRAAVSRRLAEVQGGTMLRATWRMCCKDGRQVDAQIEDHPVDIDGKVVRLVILTDLTQQTKAEIELLRSLDGLVQANGRLREMARVIAHDLQEPLRQIAGFLQLLERRYRGRLDGEAEEFIDFAVEGAHRLKTLLADAQIFAAQPVLHLAQVDFGQVAAEVLQALAPAIARAGARVTVTPLPRVAGDHDKLVLLLHALVDNALKFGRPDTPCRITLSAAREAGAWVIAVADNGLGIEPALRESVFSLFRRLHGRDRLPGNGTGLALARKLVEAHGGRIWIDEAEAGGTIFRFAIPDMTAEAAGPVPSHL